MSSRLSDISALLNARGFQSVNGLAEAFAVDTSTIRRDLDRLQEQGLARRTHGGAVPVTPDEATHSSGVNARTAEKRAIGGAMADRILEGQSILLDGGSTTLEVARALHHERLTVVTHDLRVGLEVARKPNLNLVFVGGELLPHGYAMWGPTSIQQIETMRVNVAVFGAGHVLEDGIYSTSSYEIELKRKMRSIAAEAFFVADSSKFGRDALFKVFGYEDFTAGISDSTLDPIRAAGLPVPIIRVPVT